MEKIRPYIEAARERLGAFGDRLNFWIADGHLWRLLADKFHDWRRRPAFVVTAVFLALLSLFPAWMVYHLYLDRSDLPDLGAFLRFDAPTTGEVKDARGEVLIELAHEYRRISTFDQVPPVLREAILSAEDKDFFEHDGVDYGALPRVAHKIVSRSLQEWRKGHGLRLLLPQGGSTLTQQLVRVYFLPELTARPDSDPIFHRGVAPPRLLAMVVGAHAANKLVRKLEEIRLTFWLEEELTRRFGKDRAKKEIFARYASFIYLGSGRYGYAAASEYYFGRSLESFTPQDAGDAALLAAIGKSPEAYTPDPQNDRLLRRRDQILDLMVKNGYMSADHARRCRTQPLRLAAQSPVKTEAPAAIDHVLEQLPQIENGRFAVADLLEGRIAVASTVDARIQDIVNQALENGLLKYEKRHPKAKGEIQGSVVVLSNADAAILAEAGGRQVYQNRDTKYSDFNRVTESLRQPGSTMKAVVYLTALEAGFSLDTLVPDEPVYLEMGDGSIKEITNFDDEYQGEIPLRQALAQSRNTVAVWLALQIGVGKIVRKAEELGIHSPLEANPALALGASEVKLLELANAYRAIASGLAAEPFVIDRVSDLEGRGLYLAPRATRSIASPALVALQEGLRGSVRLPGGTAASLDRRDFPISVMGKTGTTNECRDALFVGSTYGPAGITVAVRVGFDDNRPLGEKETGSKVALPIFREILLEIEKAHLAGRAPRFPREIEAGIDAYLAAVSGAAEDPLNSSPEAIPEALEKVAAAQAAGFQQGTVVTLASAPNRNGGRLPGQ